MDRNETKNILPIVKAYLPISYFHVCFITMQAGKILSPARTSIYNICDVVYDVKRNFQSQGNRSLQKGEAEVTKVYLRN